MDFHSMKRRELQALCKKHKIPANLSNNEMANRLGEFLKEENESVADESKNDEDDKVGMPEIIDEVPHRKVKKVRFSPEHELIEFTRSRGLKRRSRRNSASFGSSSLSVEEVSSGETNNEFLGGQGRVTRSRVMKLAEGRENEKKMERNGVKCLDQKDSGVSRENLANSELGEIVVNNSRRVTRLRGKVAVGGLQNETKRERKKTENVDKRDAEALNHRDGDKLNEKVLDVPVRLTGFGRRKLIEEATENEKVWRHAKNNKDASLLSADTGDGVEVITRNNKGSRNVKKVENNSRAGNKEIENQEIADENVVVEPPNKLRRSKRNVSRLGDSEICNYDTKKTDNGGSKGVKKRQKSVNGSRMDADSTGNKIDLDKGVVIQAEEPIRLSRSNRRKDVIVTHEEVENAEHQAETEKSYPLNSVQQPTVLEVYEEVTQLAKVMTRSRRATLTLKPVHTVGISKPCLPEMEKPAVGKSTRRSKKNAVKRKSSETLHDLDRDCIIQLENKAREQYESSNPNDVINASNNDLNTFSTRRESGRKRAAAEPAATVASSQEGFLEIKNSSIVESQLPISTVAESTEDLGLTSATNAKNINHDFGPTSSKKSSLERKDGTVSDVVGSADSCMQLIYRNESEIVKCMSESEFDVQKPAELCIAGKNKNDPEPQVFDQEEHLDYNKVLPYSEVLPEGSSTPVNASFAETSSIVDSLRTSDQANIETDLKATQGEGSPAQTSLAVLVNDCQINGVSIPKNSDIAAQVDVDPYNESYKSNGDVKILKTGDAIAFESCETHNGPVISKGELKPNEPSPSSKLRISHKECSAAKINETNEGGCLKDCEGASIEENVFCLLDLFDGERSTGIFQKDGRVSQEEEDCKVNNNGTYIKNSMLFESAKPGEGEASEDGKSDCIRESITSGDRTFCTEYSTEISNDKVEGGAAVGDIMQGEENFVCQGILPGEEMSLVWSLRDGNCELANQNDEGNENTYESEHPSIPLVDPVQESQDAEGGAAVGDIMQGEENFACQDILPGEEILAVGSLNCGDCELPIQTNGGNEDIYESEHSSSLLVPVPNTDCQGKTGQADEVNHTNKTVNDANWDSTKESFVDACVTYEAFSIPMPKASSESHSKSDSGKTEETEYQYKDSPTNHSPTGDIQTCQSWTEIDLNDLFRKTDDGTISGGITHTLHGSEVTRAMSITGRLINRDAVVMETEQGSESAKTMSAGCSVGMETNPLKFLFVTPCNGDGISTNRNVEKTVVSLKAEGTESMWQNMVVEMELDEEIEDSKCELENGLSQGILASDSTHAELNKVELHEFLSNSNREVCEASEELLTRDACEYSESVELGNSYVVQDLSDAEYKVSEASKELLTENTYECREENNSSTKVPLEAEYDKCEVYKTRLMENACITKVPRENEQEVCEASVEPLIDYTCEPSEESTFTVEVATKVRYTVHEISKEQLAEGSCELREEIGVENMNVVDAEFDAFEASGDQVTENAHDHKSEMKLFGNIGSASPCMIQVPSTEGMEEQLTEHTFERREEVELNEIEKIELLSPCLIQVSSVEGIEEQLSENTYVCWEETKLGAVENVELVNACSTKVSPVGESHVSEVSVERFTDYVSERREETELHELEDEDLIDACIAEVLQVVKNDAHEVSEELPTENRQDNTFDQCNQHEEATSNGGELMRRIISDSSGDLVNNEVYPDMLMDAEYSENGSCKNTSYANSTGELEQRNDTELELSNANSQRLTISTGNISSGTPLGDHSHLLDTERAISARFDTDYDSIDKGQDSPVCVRSEDILSSSAMHLLLGDDGNGVVIKSDGVPFAIETDQEIDVGGTEIKQNLKSEIVSYSESELHLEAESEDVPPAECNNFHSVPDAPVSGGNEVLKGSDVTDTIKEYIDSESSLAADLDDSTHTEASVEPANSNEILPISKPDNIEPSVEIEWKEPEGSTIALKSHSRANPLGGGSAAVGAHLDTKLLYSNAPKAARTILIHGTPRKQLTSVDMKENAPSHKASNIGDITAVRTKRKALQDVQWK